jgi:hypothetical protein
MTNGLPPRGAPGPLTGDREDVPCR